MLRAGAVILLNTALLMGGGLAFADDVPGEDNKADLIFPETFGEERKTGGEGEKWWSFIDDFRLSGYLKNETAYRYNEPRSITKIRNTFFLNAQYPFSPRYKFNFSGWAYYDLAYDLFDYDTIAARFERDSKEPLAFIVNLEHEKDSPVAEVREFYFDALMGKYDLRLGKQFVVWGVLEGVRIVDEINPMDFRELILPELLDYRVPLWTAKVDYYFPDSTLQALWIPEARGHIPAPRGSEWELLQEVPGTRHPDKYDLRNSEVGVKWSTTWWDAEWSLSYFYTWDDFPTIFRRVRLNSAQSPVFLPTYTRISVYGGTFSKQIANTVLKAEMAYVTGKYFAIVDYDENADGFLDNFGEMKRDHIRWGAGLDFNKWGIDFSPSIVQWIILDYSRAMVQDEIDTGINIFLRKEFPQSSAIFQLLGIYLVNMKEIYLKPKLTFRLTDNLQMATGLDLFYGQKSSFGVSSNLSAIGGVEEREQRAQFVGNFHDNNRVFLEFKYSF